MDFRFKYNRKPQAPDQAHSEGAIADENERRMQGLAVGLSIPTTLLGSIAAGWLIGAWLDKWLGTKFMLIVWLLLGIASGFVMVIRLLSRLNTR